MQWAKYLLPLLLFYPEGGWAKMFERKEKVIHRDPPSYDRPWLQLAPTPEKALERLISFLEQTGPGKKILHHTRKKMKRDGIKLSDILHRGNKSYINMSLVRKQTPQSNKIHYIYQSKIFINHNLTVKDALLDIAHELIHYSFKNDFNPYREDFTLDNFIISTIEGPGGEVDAYLAECSVLLALFPRKRGKGNSFCHNIIDPENKKLSRARAIKLFYRLGSHYPSFKRKVSGHNLALANLPHLSKEEALLINATYDLPYPLAALEEYVKITEQTCKNEFRRLKKEGGREKRPMANYYRRCFFTQKEKIHDI